MTIIRQSPPLKNAVIPSCFRVLLESEFDVLMDCEKHLREEKVNKLARTSDNYSVLIAGDSQLLASSSSSRYSNFHSRYAISYAVEHHFSFGLLQCLQSSLDDVKRIDGESSE